jgi:hypothetical protein
VEEEEQLSLARAPRDRELDLQRLQVTGQTSNPLGLGGNRNQRNT